MRSFHYEDQDGCVIRLDNGSLEVWVEMGKRIDIPNVTIEMAATFVEWAIQNGVKSALTYHNSGEMYVTR